VDGQPSIIGVQGHWMGRDLGLFGLEKSSGSDLESTTKIRNLDRHEPDPGLFTPPPDYNIRSLNPDDPPNRAIVTPPEGGVKCPYIHAGSEE
jgi:hypothetical protein